MIVYGDTASHEHLPGKRATVLAALRASAAARPGIVGHQHLAAALIEAGELAQAMLDLRFGARGDVDARGATEAAIMAALAGLAGALGRSWKAGFVAGDTGALVAVVAALPVPDETVTIRHPEGFAHYALYPEAYWCAARRLGPQPDAAVIGLRSIGTTLAASVAAAWGAGDLLTARPVGHPFRRRLAFAPSLAGALAARPTRLHAVVDEGPGLSGSSFGAAADALEALGVAPEAILFFPSHAGDLGSEASSAHRARWRRSRREVVGFDDLAGPGAAPQARLEAWIADLVGPPLGPAQDLSGGRWRAALPRLDAACPPPVDAQNERLKRLVPTARGPVLLRFTGLGRRGEARHDMARRLSAAGFGLAPLGWRHGFLVEPWRAEARPCRVDNPADRAAVLTRLPAYLGFRARHFPAESTGAAPDALLAMARVNVAEALGEAALARLDRWTPAVLARLVATPVRIDGRLHPWEWLALPDGAVLKADALDHHAAHDLVGAQDIAWDIAGAAVEWRLSRQEVIKLAEAVGQRAGRAVDPSLLAFFALAYRAFQLGYYTMATGRADPAERPALAAQAAHYRAALTAAA